MLDVEIGASALGRRSRGTNQRLPDRTAGEGSATTRPLTDAIGCSLDMTIVCLNWCADELFMKSAGPAAEGHLMIQPFAPPECMVEAP